MIHAAGNVDDGGAFLHETRDLARFAEKALQTQSVDHQNVGTRQRAPVLRRHGVVVRAARSRRQKQPDLNAGHVPRYLPKQQPDRKNRGDDLPVRRKRGRGQPQHKAEQKGKDFHGAS